MQRKVYLDNNATSILRPCAKDAMVKAFELVGNPSSVHNFGRATRYSLDLAREQVAGFVGVHPNQVIFTSGGTEANNWLINGVRANHIIVSAIEHVSILNAAEDSHLVPVDRNGIILTKELKDLIPNDTGKILISIMLANNETGVIQPIPEVTAIARSTGALVHTDAIQAVGKISVQFEKLNVDSMSISAHKIGGPAGVGALIVREGLDVSSLLIGGRQENRYRAGTENLLGIIGFGAAAEAAAAGIDNFQKLDILRDKLETRIKTIAPVKIFGGKAERLPNTSLLGFSGIPSETLVMALDLEGIAISSGSACSSGKIESSHVLAAMGAKDEAIRISFGWSSDEEDVEAFIEVFEKIYPRLISGLAA